MNETGPLRLRIESLNVAGRCPPQRSRFTSIFADGWSGARTAQASQVIAAMLGLAGPLAVGAMTGHAQIATAVSLGGLALSGGAEGETFREQSLGMTYSLAAGSAAVLTGSAMAGHAILIKANYTAYAAVMTPLVILLLDFGQEPSWAVVADRLVATLAGCALALTLGYLAWPVLSPFARVSVARERNLATRTGRRAAAGCRLLAGGDPSREVERQAGGSTQPGRAIQHQERQGNVGPALALLDSGDGSTEKTVMRRLRDGRQSI